ncbi:unnamed protein product [Darwinula stevensoni]|uniref:Amyloid-beta-like protein n=1 Tax=Darwinula stevensoni TaxID=69355 RepID=A0A7R8XCQ3_9CRUS|nr:unnamed protein product [Darwinula stevensoni]CAG0893974.1 unnamed protein product [Darwinula stevensoni]
MILDAVVLALGANVNVGSTVSPENGENEDAPHNEPQVAMVCDSSSFINQYLDLETGKWTSDPSRTTCLTDKISILEYCRKVYPGKEVTNIVESTHFFRLDDWCKATKPKKCKWSHWVKPYRCLVGPFQSDALLVPHGCQFDHIHNTSQCMSFEKWNGTAREACFSRSMELRSFAPLLPCGIDLFQGVEFVCCPQKTKGKEEGVIGKTAVVLPDEKEISEWLSGKEKDSSQVTPDPYLTHYDPENEHEAFRAAEKRAEKRHRERITALMKDWSQLEEKYQDMKVKDPKRAELFRKEITERFQKTVAALEGEGAAEKHQLVAMHQSRVLVAINKRKKNAMEAYKKTLSAPRPDALKVEKALQKLLRALHKDHHHTITHFQHLLKTDLGQAEKEKSVTIERLVEIDKAVNQSLEMLDPFPELKARLRPLMDQFADALRTKDLKGLGPSTLLSRTREIEEILVDMLLQQATDKKRLDEEEEVTLEKEKELNKKVRMEERKKKKQLEMEKEKETVKEETLTRPFDPESMEDEDLHKPPPVVSKPSVGEKIEKEMGQVSQHLDEEISFAHAQAHELSHQHASFSLVEEAGGNRDSALATVVLAGVALLTVLVLTIVILRRRHSQSPHGQVGYQ